MNTETTTKDFDFFIELVKSVSRTELKPFLMSYKWKQRAICTTKQMQTMKTIAGWNIKLKQKIVS